MKKIKRLSDDSFFFENGNPKRTATVYVSDLDELEQQLELLKGKNKALQNVVDNYYTNSAISMINDLREKLSIVARQRDEAVEALIEHAIHYENVTSLVPKKTVYIIEKLTGQTWEEIKAGYKNDWLQGYYKTL